MTGSLGLAGQYDEEWGGRGDLAGSFPDAGIFCIAYRVNRVF